jgi:hypothetical protein
MNDEFEWILKKAIKERKAMKIPILVSIRTRNFPNTK